MLDFTRAVTEMIQPLFLVGQESQTYFSDYYLNLLVSYNEGNVLAFFTNPIIIIATLLSIVIFATVSWLGATILSRWHVATNNNDATGS